MTSDMTLDELVEHARAYVAEPNYVDQPILVGEKLVTARIHKLPGDAWRDLIAKHPPRAGALIDARRNYNVTAVTKAYPHVALILEDGTEIDASPRWSEIAGALDGPDLENLEFAVWGKNEYDQQERLQGKVRARETSKKPSSRESSESPSES
ncbi:hypothetical protein [Microbacterium gilvum]|uniref:Uncharacterized protein n=1 Tax=Microbacterium gilvum TaxID=1336204 RepID=A0ABP8ZR51_9MICO